MKTTLKIYKVKDVIRGFVYNELEGKGLFGLSGSLTIQPEYQRNYIYASNQMEIAVIESLLKEYPLGILYFNQSSENEFEVLDGQQRITSIGRFVTSKFAIIDENKREQLFSSLPTDKQKLIMESDLLVYHCEGEESEIKEWFKTINIKGVPLNEQELLNAIFSGPFVSIAKQEFSNSNNSNIQKWKSYIKGDANRQDIMRTALSWISYSKKQDIDGYMAEHRSDDDISELKIYFNSVIDWISSVFNDVLPEMCGLKWGELYEKYHHISYNPEIVSKNVHELYGDVYVTDKKGIFEYILAAKEDTKLLNIRFFDEAIKKATYSKQTRLAEEDKISNCPLCAVGHDSNNKKIWALKEMEADHVTAWSKGGSSDISNCQMLCKTHNSVKGNR